MSELQRVGIDLIQWLQQSSPALDPPMLFLSFLGREEFFVIFVGFLYWAVSPSWGARALAVLLLSDFTNGLAKWALHEPRPFWIAPVKVISLETSYGIPSGHAQTGAAFWGLQAATIRRRWAWVAAAVLVLGISLSRLYLGVHFPHDVVAGWAIGVAVLAAYLAVERRAAAWMAPRSARQCLPVALGIAFASLAAGIGVWMYLAATTDPAAWAQAAGAEASGRPSYAPRDLGSALATWGAMLGAAVGVVFFRPAQCDAAGTWPIRLLRFALGLVGLLAIRVGLALLFPDEPGAMAWLFRYVRYAMMTLWAVWLAPLAFVRLGLARVRPAA